MAVGAPPSIRPRRDDRRHHHQRARDSQRPGRLREAERHQQGGGEDQRGIGEHAQQRHAALLHADVPQHEGATDGADP